LGGGCEVELITSTCRPSQSQANARRRAPQGKVQLMPKPQYLGVKPGARPEQVGDDRHKGTKDRKHRAS